MTENARKRMYEALFLVEPQIASTAWTKVQQDIEGLIQRHGGTVVRLRKWEERKLSYPVKKRQRGTYVLTYFESPTQGIDKLKKEIALSETVLRALVLVFEGTLKDEAEEVPPPPAPAAAAPEPAGKV